MTNRQSHNARLLLVALCAAGVLTATGCGDSSTGGTTNHVQAGADAGTDSAGGVDLNLAASLQVALDPARGVYHTGANLTPTAIVYDGHGETMGAVNVKWTVTPADLVTEDSGKYKLDDVGDVTFKACTVDDGVDGVPVCGQKKIVVDRVSPTVEITKPAPGAWLGADGSQTVTVEGTVSDTHGELHAFVDGQGVDLDDNGHFSTTIEPDFGVNHLEVVATDGVTRASGQSMLDFIWAPAWYDMSDTATATAFSFDDGLVLDLGQRFFDDGQLPQQPDESTFVTQDLADILTLLVQNIDFMSQIPDPVLDTSSGQLHITDLTLGQPQIVLDLTDTGAELYIWVPSVVMQTQGGVAFNSQTLDLTGSITADLAGYAELSIDKPGPGQPFEAQVDDIDLALQNAHSNFVSAQANAVFKLAESALRNKIETILVGTLRSQFVDQLPTLLANALNSVEDQLSGLSFDLNTDFTDPLTVSLDGSIDNFQTSYRNSMKAVLSTDVSANKAPALTGTPGIPLATEYTSDIPLFQSSRAQVGVRLGLLNGLLHALWESGFLEIDLTDLMPSQYAGMTDKATLSVKLQPVLSPPKAGEPYDFMLRAGQMEIEAHLLNQVDTYAVNLQVGILMSLADNSISITVPDPPEVTAWVKNTTGDHAVLDDATIKGLILNQVWPQIEQTLQQGLSFQLPVPSLSGLSTLAPTLSNLDVQFLLNRPVEYRDGFIMFDAMLQGTLPLGQ